MAPDVQRDEGCVSLFAIRSDGGVGKLLDRLILQGVGSDPIVHGSAHPHSVQIDDEDFVVIPNKGGDNIYVAKLNRETERLEALSVCPCDHGSSPRHLCFVPDTPWVLIQNEFDAHLCSYHLNRETGYLTPVSQVDTIDRSKPTTVTSIGTMVQQWGLDVQVHPNGCFVYTNNTVGTVYLTEVPRLDAQCTHMSHIMRSNPSPLRLYLGAVHCRFRELPFPQISRLLAVANLCCLCNNLVRGYCFS